MIVCTLVRAIFLLLSANFSLTVQTEGNELYLLGHRSKRVCNWVVRMSVERDEERKERCEVEEAFFLYVCVTQNWVWKCSNWVHDWRCGCGVAAERTTNGHTLSSPFLCDVIQDHSGETDQDL